MYQSIYSPYFLHFYELLRDLYSLIRDLLQVNLPTLPNEVDTIFFQFNGNVFALWPSNSLRPFLVPCVETYLLLFSEPLNTSRLDFISAQYPTKSDQFGILGVLFQLKYLSYVHIKSPYLLPGKCGKEMNCINNMWTPCPILKHHGNWGIE
jgi:hypothetical protein